MWTSFPECPGSQCTIGCIDQKSLQHGLHLENLLFVGPAIHISYSPSIPMSSKALWVA